MRTTGKAFTMIELLVVISIIMFLIAMTLPNMSEVREHVKVIICQNNMAAIMESTLHYANDNQDHLPFPNWGGNGIDCCGWTDGGWLYKNPHPGSPFTDAEWQSEAIRDTGLIFPYMSKTSRGYKCPNDYPPYWKGGYLSSYCMNGSVCNYGRGYTYAVIQFKNDDIMYWEVEQDFGEGGIGDGGWWDGSNFPNEGMSNDRHFKGGAAVSVDTSVEWMTYADYEAEKQKQPGRLWNTPDSANGTTAPN
jgi:type II secretory pathway pseudopilin PulG